MCEISEDEAFRIADGVAHRPDGTSQTLAWFAREVRRLRAELEDERGKQHE